MKRNKKGTMPEITREIYRGVKKYDRQQFQQFCVDMYKYGYEDGRASVPGIELAEVVKAIGEVKEIGPAKLKAIEDALNEEFKDKQT